MTLNEAYKILGINSDVSEDEIKKAYKTLSRKYHPDANVTKSSKEKKEAEEKFKQVNNAYQEIMKNKDNFATNKQTNNKQKNDIEKIREEIIVKVNNFKKEIDKDFLKQLYPKKEAELKIDEIEFLCSVYITLFEFGDSLQEINEKFLDFQKEIKEFYLEIEDEYFFQNDIPTKTNTLNYKCSFPEFVEQLKKEKEKNDQRVNAIINKETEEYKLYAGYEFLENKIEQIKTRYQKIIAPIAEKEKQDIIIAQMKAEILNLFKRYYEQQKKYQSLTNIPVDKIEEQDLNKFVQLKEYIGTEEFDSLYKELKEKYERIANKITFEENEKQIRKIHQNVRKKASRELAKLNLNDDIQKYFSILDIEKQILCVIERGKNGLIDFESLKELENITFQDELKDTNILQAISSNVHAISNLYVFKNASYPQEVLYWLTNDSGTYYINYMRYRGIESKIIEIETLNKHFIPLTKFLEEAKFYGVKNYIEEIILYVKGNLALKIQNGRFIMEVSETYRYMPHYEKVAKEEILLYQDHEYIVRKMIKQINNDLEQAEYRKK